ncbi:MAG: CRISPR-associated endonuclease Cas1 [Bacteroidetes bacterium 4572_117]|nr:MAG: CRISPR-associated endonuclease Cas1 [Bacteroidetes bacterium 4572_117]
MELVLNTFGTYLTKDNDTFMVAHKDGKQRIAPAKLKSVLISKGAQISSDAAMLAIEHNIDVFFVDGTGKPVGRIWSNKFGSITTIRRKQLDFTFSAKAVKWIKDIVAEKIDNQIAMLLSLQVDDSIIENKFKTYINRLTDYKTKIMGLESEVVSDIAASLRGWEGSASRNYFAAINLVLPKEHRFEKRSQHPATDAFNALLNYGYGILYGKIEGALIKAGIDPYVGVFHREDYNRPVLVFDIIEKYRIWIDYVVISITSQKAINHDCYSVRNDGSYWLEGLGKRILIQSVNDYFDEVIMLKGMERSRATHINLYAQNLAQMFLKLKDN